MQQAPVTIRPADRRTPQQPALPARRHKTSGHTQTPAGVVPLWPGLQSPSADWAPTRCKWAATRCDRSLPAVLGVRLGLGLGALDLALKVLKLLGLGVGVEGADLVLAPRQLGRHAGACRQGGLGV